MNLIETYNGSGFYAQYADSALYDANGTPLTSYMTAVPAGTMNESAFSYDASDNITAYNGSAFKAGDEFPQSATEAIETVTANSADWNGTTETVSSNSGVWGGSALPISAGPGIKVELVDNTLVFSNDETVLLNNNYAIESTQSFTLAEPLSNFKRIRVAGLQYNDTLCEYEFQAPTGNENISILMQYYCPNGDGNPYQLRMAAYNTSNSLTYNAISGKFLYYGNDGITAAGGNTTDRPSIQKVWGVHRIAGGN